MIGQIACPTDFELIAFDRGELAEPAMLALGAHLETCSECEQRVGELDAQPDGVAAVLRRSEESTAPEPALADTSVSPQTALGADEAWPSPPGYELLEMIGTGGMGVVYKARQTELKRLVALKRVKSFAGSARFRAEAEAVAQLQHPAIVEIFEIGEQAGQPFLVLEYIEGGSLETLLESGPQCHRGSAGLVERLANAVHYAHSKGIVHRDLKPANVLLVEEPDSVGENRIANLQPKITDFGIAKRLETDSGLTREGDAVGTPSYMAPEQAEGRKADIGTPADIYALGAILYELLTGRPPFREETALATLEAVRSAEPTPPSRLKTETPRDLEAICLKCLEKTPQRRYSSAAALAEDLHRFQSGRPVEARPVTQRERFVRWCLRNRVVTSLLVTVGLLVVSVAVVASIGYVKEKSAREQAEYQRDRRETNFKKAREAVDTMLTRVAESHLLNQPRMLPMRQRILEDALEYYRGFLEEKSDDPDIRSETAAAYARIGYIYRLLGKDAESIKSYREAVSLSQRLADDFPAEFRHRKFLAEVHNDLGVVEYSTGRIKQAEKSFRKAIALKTRLRNERPDDVEVRLSLASSYTDLGIVLYDDRRDDSIRASRTAVEHFESMPTSVRGESKNRMHYSLITSYLNLSRGIFTRDPNEAERLCRRSLKLAKRLAGQHPDWPRYQDLLGRVHFQLGVVHQSYSGRPELGEPSLAAAAAVFERLVRDFPNEIEYRQHLAGSNIMLAFTLERLRKLPEAERLCRKTLKSFPRLPKNQVHRHNHHHADAYRALGSILRAQRRVNESQQALESAIQRYHQLIAKFPGDTEIRRHLSMAHRSQGINFTILRRRDAAAQHFVKARDIQEKLVSEAPEDFTFSDLLSNSHLSLALHFDAAGKYPEAVNSYKRCAALVESLLSRMPEHAGFRTRLAKCVSHLGDLQLKRRRPQEAESCYRKVVALYEVQLRKPDATPDDRRMAAGAYYNLANFLKRGQKPTQAVPYYQKAIALHDTLLGESRGADSEHHRYHAAICYGNLAQALTSLDRLSEALSFAEKSLKLFERIVKAAPDNTPFKRSLAIARHDVARLLSLQSVPGRRSPNRAVELADLAVKSGRHHAAWQATLGIAHYRAGNWRKSIEWCGKSAAAARGPDDPLPMFFLAMAHWKLGEKKKAGDWYAKAAAIQPANGIRLKYLSNIMAEAQEMLGITN